MLQAQEAAFASPPTYKALLTADRMRPAVQPRYLGCSLYCRVWGRSCSYPRAGWRGAAKCEA